ncbi:hypothetical protein J0H58_37195, partial [bacterium]|nr:hypothetical protein [bacterium]
MSNPNEPTPRDDLPPIPPPPPPHLGEGDDVPMALTDFDEVAEILPAAEVAADAATFGLPDVPGDDPASGVRLAEPAEGLPPIPEALSPGESWMTEGGSDVLAGGEIPAAQSASSSALFDEGPAPLVHGEEVDLSAPSPSASSLFGESVPDAGPASGFLTAEAAAGDSAVNVDGAPPVAPVVPASGWFPPEEGSLPVVPPEPPADAIEAELAGPLPATDHGAGSDIFAAAPPSSRLLADQS